MKDCECGCGQPAPIAKQSYPALGYVKGQPMRFIPGHRNRKAVRVRDIGVERRCTHCGATFRAYKEHRNFHRKYCSRACATAVRKAQTLAAYPPREEAIRLYREEGLSDKEIGRRYGRSYQWALTMRQHYGIVGRRTGGWKSRRGLRVRDPGVRTVFSLVEKGEDCCRNCGRQDGLNLHHAIPRSMYRDGRAELRNGIPLCVACHMGWHRRQVAIYRDVFTPEEWTYLTNVRLLGQVTRAWLDDRYPERSTVRRPGLADGTATRGAASETLVNDEEAAP